MKVNQANEVILNHLGSDWKSIEDLVRRASPIRYGTVRGALKRLLAAKSVERSWDGNMRYGRYVYRICAETAQHCPAQSKRYHPLHARG
jgi:DNA-binding transcriptional ArsR family regulator